MKKIRIKIRNFFLLAGCYLRFIVSGRADEEVARPSKILVVQMSKLGDMVCTTPVFRAIKSKYPQSEVWVVGDGANKILLQSHPDVDGYVVCRGGVFDLIGKLKKIKFDFACVVVPDFDSLAAVYLAGVPLICVPKIASGYSPYNTKSFRLAAKLAVTRDYGVEKYAPGEYLKLLEPIGIYTDDTKKHLAFSSLAKEKIQGFFTNNGVSPESEFVIGLSPAAGNKIKLWSPAKFAALINHISKLYQVKIVIIGARTDEPLVAEMIGYLNKESQIINTVGFFGLEELKALISRLSLFISVDTGPIYIAEAFDVPTIDIVGPVDENVQPPRGKFNKIVKVKRDRAEMYILNSRCYNRQEAKRQIDEISVEMVIEQFEQLASAINGAGFKVKIGPRRFSE